MCSSSCSRRARLEASLRVAARRRVRPGLHDFLCGTCKVDLVVDVGAVGKRERKGHTLSDGHDRTTRRNVYGQARQVWISRSEYAFRNGWVIVTCARSGSTLSRCARKVLMYEKM